MRVYQKGSAIFLQLWALGRVALPDVAQAEGFDIVGSSPSPLDSRSLPVSKALSKEENQGFRQRLRAGCSERDGRGLRWRENPRRVVAT